MSGIAETTFFPKEGTRKVKKKKKKKKINHSQWHI